MGAIGAAKGKSVAARRQVRAAPLSLPSLPPWGALGWFRPREEGHVSATVAASLVWSVSCLRETLTPVGST